MGHILPKKSICQVLPGIEAQLIIIRQNMNFVRLNSKHFTTEQNMHASQKVGQTLGRSETLHRTVYIDHTVNI